MCSNELHTPSIVTVGVASRLLSSTKQLLLAQPARANSQVCRLVPLVEGRVLTVNSYPRTQKTSLKTGPSSVLAWYTQPFSTSTEVGLKEIYDVNHFSSLSVIPGEALKVPRGAC